MAVTKILSRTGNLKQLLEYIANEGKITKLPVREQTGYRKGVVPVESGEIRYISGHNCFASAEMAYEDMAGTKAAWGKEGGVSAYHLIQSFYPGETDPETAHKIAMKLAQDIFPDFEVLITTHLDKGHIHNHFAVNSVSFASGRKFSGKEGSLENYWTGIRRRSDELCREHRLSVIENPKYGEGRKYASYREKRMAGAPAGAPAIRFSLYEAYFRPSPYFGFSITDRRCSRQSSSERRRMPVQ
jgi:hypothetical protein